MLIAAWKIFIPMYFALNNVNYARYGSYYVHTLVNMERIYLGLRGLLEERGLSVQAQDLYPLRTSIDQRGEQTINRDAKTSGKILYPCTILKIINLSWGETRQNFTLDKCRLSRMLDPPLYVHSNLLSAHNDILNSVIFIFS